MLKAYHFRKRSRKAECWIIVHYWRCYSSSLFYIYLCRNSDYYCECFEKLIEYSLLQLRLKPMKGILSFSEVLFFLWLWELFQRTSLSDLTIPFYKILNYLKVVLTLLSFPSLQYKYYRVTCLLKTVRELMVNFIVKIFH